MSSSPSISPADVVSVSLEILATHGLGDLSMRRVAQSLGVQPSALYWHVANKQTLLALMADALLEQIQIPPPTGQVAVDVKARSVALYRGLLSTPDAAELVTSVIALGAGGNRFRDVLADVSPDSVLVDAVVSLVLGNAVIVQQRHQAAELGVLEAHVARALTTDIDDMLDLLLG